ncbi:MAG: sugar phosphate isomerase/epimerase, partial [Bryobacteraceae bacterium]
MPALKELEVGAMFWATEDPAATIREAKSLGVRCGQLGIPGDLPLAGMAEAWKSVLARENFTVITAFCAYTGESYADIPTVEATVGYIPRNTRAEREARTIEVSDFAAAAGIPGLGCHAGFVPEDH